MNFTENLNEWIKILNKNLRIVFERYLQLLEKQSNQYFLGESDSFLEERIKNLEWLMTFYTEMRTNLIFNFRH